MKLILIGLLLMTPYLVCTVTQNQAIITVIDTVLVNELDSIDVYVSKTTFDNDGLDLIDDSTIIGSYDDYWAFYIDNYPGTNWSHPCRYLILDQTTGDYYLINKSLYPKDLSNEFQLCHTYFDTTLSTVTPSSGSSGTTLREENNNLYAVIISGVDYEIRWWNSISYLYSALLEQGYQEDNIFIHFAYGYYNGENGTDFDGDQDQEEVYSAYLDTIKTTFKNLSGETNVSYPDLQEIPVLTPHDQLLVACLSHGQSEGYYSETQRIQIPPPGETEYDLWDYDLELLVRNIDCSQMIFFFQNCYGGGFIPELDDNQAQCQNRLILTASSQTELSQGELHFSYTYDYNRNVSINLGHFSSLIFFIIPSPYFRYFQVY